MKTDQASIDKTKRQINLFQITSIYNHPINKAEIERLSYIHDEYDLSYQKLLVEGKLFGKVFKDEADLYLRFEKKYGIPKDNVSASKMLLGKLKRDIAKELKIIR